MPAEGLTVLCRNVDLGLLQKAEEVFVCNAVRGLTAVTEITGLNQTLFSTEGAHPGSLSQTRLIQAGLGKQYPCFGE